MITVIFSAYGLSGLNEVKSIIIMNFNSSNNQWEVESLQYKEKSGHWDKTCLDKTQMVSWATEDHTITDVSRVIPDGSQQSSL